jgi:hypothetical protein
MQMSVRAGGLWNPGTQSAKTTWPGGGGGGSVVEDVDVVDVVEVEAGAAAVVVVARGAALGESGVPPVQAVTTIATMSNPSCRLMNGWTTAGGFRFLSQRDRWRSPLWRRARNAYAPVARPVQDRHHVAVRGGDEQ